MEVLKNKFHRELSDLDKLISFYNSELKLLGDLELNDFNLNNKLLSELSTNLKAFSISKRQFNYNSIIISLYGAFERFIENTLVSFVDKINKIVDKYDQLPEAIIKNHLTLSLALLNKIEQTRYSGTLKKNDIINNLHTCININQDYQLNKDAFAYHTANFRLQVIDETFARVGVQGISNLLIKNHEFSRHIIAKNEKSSSKSVTNEESFYFLNDLAERRNDVAHGVASEILQNDILRDYIEYFKFYSEALSQVLENKILHTELNYSGKEIGEITNAFKNGRVICIYTNKFPIKVGDTVIGKNKSEIVKANIVGMKINEISVNNCDDQDNYEIGIELDQKFKKNFRVSLVPTLA
ncbi:MULTISPECIES: MAE_28990/MAE_18760 family HEPN-like nuclease [unclassified Imperialibacter]|uniref:MAE_28990/MAE_18760 family HEPN-like nuclease n=1 Tax=unclassified Imperialibacter TaxID=2629706 RepID=UPI00125A79CF|nr:MULTISPECIES: MAE_28990/MAE_18760 family HEPN-like nuclease [unclassified Imperialibacter]CAD5279406.1 conserved hypothetical protein [Imperialibacter sp. 89]CAD5293436.1 conserved hypothetical protein [Imperialibacter sp. 75]VVS98810.1 conserved hypothetical protein [Imperialibacter sp. EC-SDR9]